MERILDLNLKFSNRQGANTISKFEFAVYLASWRFKAIFGSGLTAGMIGIGMVANWNTSSARPKNDYSTDRAGRSGRSRYRAKGYPVGNFTYMNMKSVFQMLRKDSS